MCEAEVPRAFVRRGSRSQEAALCCGADLGAALSARPGGFRHQGWILWPSGNAHSPTPLGLPGSAQSPSPRGLSESAQSPFPARPGPRPSDALALAGQLLFTSSFFHHPCYDLPTPAASSLSCLPRRSPSASGFQPHFPWKLTFLTLLFVGTWKGEGEKQMTTLNTGSARLGTAVGLLKLFLLPLTCHLITLLFCNLCPQEVLLLQTAENACEKACQQQPI